MEVMVEQIWSMNYTDIVVPRRQYQLLWPHGILGLTSKEVKVNNDQLLVSSKVPNASRRYPFSAKAGASRSSTGQRTWAKFGWEDVWKQKDPSAIKVRQL